MARFRKDRRLTNLTLIVSGAATAVTFPTYLLQLRERLERVRFRLVVTRAAERFLPMGSIADIADDVFLDRANYNPLEVIEQSGWTFVLPATMNTITTSAFGLGTSPTQSVLAGLGNRVTYFPSMPRQYWEAPSTLRAVSELRSQNRIVIDPVLTRTFEFYNREFRDFYRPEEPQVVCALVESTCIREGLI